MRTRIILREQVVLVARCILASVCVLAGMVVQVRAAPYVVDRAAPVATDTNPGTEQMPFKTVQHAADVVKPGDTVYVMAGKYDERIKVKISGTEGKPVAFVAKRRRSVVVGGFDLEASYIRVEGFEITADRPATAIQLRASHCEILDN
jgi:pectin methylesterase-like acyl-CoA thioesterase